MSGGNGADSVKVEAAAPGEGQVEMIIGTEAGKVVQRFQRPMAYVLYEPENAAYVGREILNAAVACGAKVQINVPRVKVSREKRDAMIARAAQIHRSLLERNRDPLAIAREVVDQTLAQLDNLG